MTRPSAQAPPRLVVLSRGGPLAAGALPARLVEIRRALDAGLPGLLLREPELGERARLELLEAVLEVRPEGTWIGVHDSAALALELGVEALHLAHHSLPGPELAARLSRQLALGASTHAGDAPAAFGWADYAFHSPVHPTPSKPGAAGIGFETLRDFVARAPFPVLALGGMGPGDLARARRAGAHGIACRSAVWAAPDPGRATAALVRELEALEGTHP